MATITRATVVRKMPVAALPRLGKSGLPAVRSFAIVPTRPLQGSTERDANRSVKAAGEEVKKTAEATREKVNDVAEDQIIDKGLKAAGKAKQKLQETWDSAKECTEKVKEAVGEKAEGAKEAVVDSIEGAKRAVKGN
ncbi:hypothetical protein HPP92_012286 [Vanilla planifolia]|uniref:Uncharacterized protein n=1 Tax=Vanilla planifolia TaxID=51239 RepID=A0A835R197_VANPL|nr:hypothetical protein HPP92_012286 [Vanilla planifolia]